jgi:hypothetical protein
VAVTRFCFEDPPFSPLSKVSGGGIVRVVACVAAVGDVTLRGGGEVDDDGSDGDDNGLEDY